METKQQDDCWETVAVIFWIIVSIATFLLGIGWDKHQSNKHIQNSNFTFMMGNHPTALVENRFDGKTYITIYDESKVRIFRPNTFIDTWAEMRRLDPDLDKSSEPNHDTQEN